MKQKLKLALALYSETDILLLDEPTSNFDKENINWYLNVTESAAKNKTLIICSNQQYEYSFCQKVLNVNMYK
jgi:ABC-type multidrug transport system ATPase subunit